MSQLSDRRNGPINRGRRAEPDQPLVLLDDGQWSYLQRRYDLTPREVQIASLVCQGLRNGKIAKCLDICPGTVKTHVRNIYRKVKVKSKMTMLLRFVGDAHSGYSGGRQVSG